MTSRAALDGVLIETDDRGRTNLSKLSKNGTFLARREADGTIILEPATIVTDAQQRLLRNPHAIAAARKGKANEDNAVTVTLAGEQEL